jgi:hypothetical protein
LPPVGAEANSKNGVVLIKAYFGSQVWYQSQHGEDIVRLIESAEFRPLRTEEDKAVEAMIPHLIGKALDYESLCREIYRAGYRKTESESAQ